jgi:geranylgeranyl diphosphate synthase type 3
MLFQKLLQPYTYLQKASGKGNHLKFMHAFNYWLKVPADKLTVLEDIFEMMYNGILL